MKISRMTEFTSNSPFQRIFSGVVRWPGFAWRVFQPNLPDFSLTRPSATLSQRERET